MNFLRNWVNAKPEQELSLETLEEMLEGNLHELQSLLSENLYLNNTVRVMLTVVKRDDKYYQGVFYKYFARSYNKGFVLWQKFFAKDERNLPKGVVWSYELKPFEPPAPEMETPDNVQQAAATPSTQWAQLIQPDDGIVQG